METCQLSSRAGNCVLCVHMKLCVLRYHFKTSFFLQDIGSDVLRDPETRVDSAIEGHICKVTVDCWICARGVTTKRYVCLEGMPPSTGKSMHFNLGTTRKPSLLLKLHS